MKLKHILLFAAISGVAAAGPEAGGGAGGHIPEWLDTDGDGVISEAERQAFIESRREAIEGLHAKWDTNGDGVIDEEERQAAIDALRARVEERLCELFEGVAGEDGVLTLDEFSALHPVGKLPERITGLLFGLLDGDGDEEVTKEEFLAAIGGNPNLPDPPDTPLPPLP